ncbi:sodium/hydrogen exchanger 9B1 [Perognathus longimembris pacificus]|uniref:sodium/hydrogen exchanger 9B1 n=1 Tax=Perognathus longimembris pacificus TaxID=214514 RepID=UPI002019EA0F|nr:sodium/hydrogen exchanger 9B1 [Perognathus longimembris pacificus]
MGFDKLLLSPAISGRDFLAEIPNDINFVPGLLQPTLSMSTTQSENKLLEDETSLPPTTSIEILHDPNSSTHEESKETVLLETEEPMPQVKKKTYLSCPPRGRLNKIITYGIILFSIWGILWALSGPEALPGGNLFALLVIFFSAFLGGKLLQLIKIPTVPPLPPLLGMLLAGFLIRNLPYINKYVHVQTTWSSTLRITALTIILMRAGLGLDPEALKHLKGVCLRLSFGPCITEACSAAIFSHFIMKFPWKWGFLLGFILGAVSPAVVVPSMLFLQEKGYGVEKGIPTLLVAASSMDDIIAITGFNIFLSLAFSTGAVIHNLLSSLREIVIAVLVGVILGCFAHYFPSSDQEKLPKRRAFLMLSMCIFVVLGSERIGLHGSGGLCTLVLTFVAGNKWSKDKTEVQKIISKAWNIFQPLLFGLVGSEVSVASLESNTIGFSVIILSLALCTRILTAFLLMSFAGFTFKEKIFIALAWMPKATVQAVLGPLAMETARLTSAPELEVYAKNVMTMAFLAILITAPNGALFIGILGPKVLTRHDDSSNLHIKLSDFQHH